MYSVTPKTKFECFSLKPFLDQTDAISGADPRDTTIKGLKLHQADRELREVGMVEEVDEVAAVAAMAAPEGSCLTHDWSSCSRLQSATACCLVQLSKIDDCLNLIHLPS